MNLHRMGVTVIAALGVTLTLALPAHAQVKADGDGGADVRRMEIWNGGARTTHYFSQNVSPGEEAALRDLERAENGMAFASQLDALRRLYLRNEYRLELRRGEVNPLLYGYSSEYAAGLINGVVTGGYGGWGGFPYGYPYGIGGFGNIGAAFAYPGVGAGLGSVTNSLAMGVGNEGTIKNELARTLTDPAVSDIATRAARAYDAAWARVGSSDRLVAGLRKHNVVPVAEQRVTAPVSVTMKDGKTIDGTLVGEDPDWITVETDKEQVSLRKSDVTRISRPKREVKP
jgi:hypothetical protein